MTKAISAVIATILLLMITVSLVGVFYAFSATIAGSSTSSGGQQASQLTSQLSMCMRIDNIYGNQVTLRNCGKGVIDNKSLVVTIDDVKLWASTTTINEGDSGTVNITGLWQIQPGKRNLKISNGAAFALALVEVKPNPDGLVGSWDFDEGSGTTANDGSGNGNMGTLLPTGSPPTWVNGKFGKGLHFDGTNDYVSAGNGTSLNFDTNDFTVEVWAKADGGITGRGIINKGGWGSIGYAIQEAESPANQYYFVVQDGAGYKSVGILSETWGWTHIVGIKTTNHLEAWVNGVKVGEFNGVIGSLSNPTKAFEIGRSFNSYYFNGTIDEVRIYNRALTPDEAVTMKQII